MSQTTRPPALLWHHLFTPLLSAALSLQYGLAEVVLNMRSTMAWRTAGRLG